MKSKARFVVGWDGSYVYGKDRKDTSNAQWVDTFTARDAERYTRTMGQGTVTIFKLVPVKQVKVRAKQGA